MSAPTPTPAPTPVPPTPAPTPAPEPQYKAPESQAELDRIIGTRLNQERAKYGGLTAEQITEIRDKAGKFDKSELEKGTDLQRTAAEAKEAAEKAADAKYLPKLAETAFRIAIGTRGTADEVTEFLADTKLENFVKEDGSVDTAKVLARVDKQFSDGKPSKTPPPKGPVVPGHTAGGPPSAAGDQGRAMAEKRFGKKQQ